MLKLLKIALLIIASPLIIVVGIHALPVLTLMALIQSMVRSIDQRREYEADVRARRAARGE